VRSHIESNYCRDFHLVSLRSGKMGRYATSSDYVVEEVNL
jgi:hypothetical protein